MLCRLAILALLTCLLANATAITGNRHRNAHQFDVAAPTIPSFALNNSAVKGLRIPAVGLGLGAYAFKRSVGYGGYPECLDYTAGCGDYAYRAVREWFDVGGRRLDTANTYYSDPPIARAIKDSGIAREDIFILSKVGPAPQDVPLGYRDLLGQFDSILSDYDTDYIDLLLIHWPQQQVTQSQDLACRVGTPNSSFTNCRLNSWRAMLEIFNSGKARAIGVSNYNITHLQEIIDAGLPLPAYNQMPFHLYRNTVNQPLIDFCRQHGIMFGGYSPMAVPDFFTFSTDRNAAKGNRSMAFTPLADPDVLSIAAAHKVSPAQVILQWHYARGIPTNPRSQNRQHMNENVNSYTFTLSQQEIATLDAAPQDLCSIDPQNCPS